MIVDEAAVIAALSAYLSKAPNWARYFKVRLDAGGQLDRDDLARAAQERVMIQFRPR